MSVNQAHDSQHTTQPLLCDDYPTNLATGSFILIGEATGSTVGAGMINS